MEILQENPTRETFKRLDITNAVMFALVMMRNHELCGRVISASIGRKIDEVDVVTTESTIIAGVDSKKVKLDAVVRAGGQVFDVEMQVARVGNIPRRARYYHSMMNIEFLNGGDDYDLLPDSYVIFIGAGPLLGRGFDSAPSRTFEMRDVATGRPLGDGATTVILDATAWKQANGELAEMLEFVERGDEASALSNKDSIATALQNAVERVKEKEDDMGIMTAAHQLDLLEKANARKDEKILELEGLVEKRTLECEAAYNEGEAKGKAEANESLQKLLGSLLDEGRLSQAEVEELMNKHRI